MNIAFSVTLGCDMPGWTKCPRCLRWTGNDGPYIGGGNVCWRCQDVLCNYHQQTESGKLVIAWRQQKGLPA